MSATQASSARHDPVVVAKVTEDQMSSWLWRHFVTGSWAVIPQATISMRDVTGGTPTNVTDIDGGLADRVRDAMDRRIDLLLARKSRKPEKTGALETMSVEIKVSRQDFLSDIRNPDKQAPWRSATTRHVYAVPAGLVQAEEVPPSSGLLWVSPPAHKHGVPEVVWVRKAPYVPGHAPRLPMRVFVAMLHRVTHFEGSTRGWGYRVEGSESVEDLRADLKAAKKATEKAENEARKAKATAEAWKRAYAITAKGGVPCALCGEPIKPVFVKGEWFREWRHLNPEHAAPCAAAEEQTRIDRAKAEYNTALADGTLERELTRVHRYGLVEAVHAEPWRAFLDWARLSPHPVNEFAEDTCDIHRHCTGH